MRLFAEKRKNMMCWHGVFELSSFESSEVEHTHPLRLHSCLFSSPSYSYSCFHSLPFLFLSSSSVSKLYVCLLIISHTSMLLVFPLLLFYHPTHQVTLTTELCLAQTWNSHSIRVTSTECRFQTKKTPNLIPCPKHKCHLRVLAVSR